MNKIYLLRILQCTLLYLNDMPELEINKLFNFKEMDFSKKLITYSEKINYIGSEI